MKKSLLYALSLGLQLGFIIALPLVFLGLLGRFLDKYFGTSPWFLLLGIFFALIISFLGIYQRIQMILKQETKE